MELEKYIICDVKEDGSWNTNPSALVKNILAELAETSGLTPREVREKIFLEGFSLAYVELMKKGKKEVIVRDLSDHSERPVVVFGKKES
jgi:hypothetical protein